MQQKELTKPGKRAIKIEQLRAYRCKKNLLLDSEKGTHLRDVTDKLIAINANSIGDTYLTYYNRLKYFAKEELDKHLYVTKTIARLKGMRTDFFIVHKDAVEMLYCSTYEQREQVCKQVTRNFDLSDQQLEALTELIKTNLQSGEKTKRKISKNVPPEYLEKIEYNVGKNIIRSNQVEQTLNILLERWEVVPGKDTWNSDGKKLCLFEDLHGDRSFPENYNDATSNLILSYIKRYGPVSLDDISWWCGTTIARARETIEKHKNTVRMVDFDFSRKEYFIFGRDAKEFLYYDKPVSDSYLFLGKNDPLIMGYKIVDSVINKKHFQFVFDKYGESEPVVLINGHVVGKWSFAEGRETVTINIALFSRVPQKSQERLYRQVDRLSDFLGGDEKETVVEISYK